MLLLSERREAALQATSRALLCQGMLHSPIMMKILGKQLGL